MRDTNTVEQGYEGQERGRYMRVNSNRFANADMQDFAKSKRSGLQDEFEG